MTRGVVRFLRRGEIVEVADFAPETTLLDYLRLTERSRGTKEGCGEGDCGACTVALGSLRDGKIVYEPVNACIVLLGQAEGKEIVTVDDLATNGALHPQTIDHPGRHPAPPDQPAIAHRPERIAHRPAQPEENHEPEQQHREYGEDQATEDHL